MKLNKQRALQTHRHAMFALDVSQINWRTTVAHLPTEDSGYDAVVVRIFFTNIKGTPSARRGLTAWT
jgi:hypothetical protein